MKAKPKHFIPNLFTLTNMFLGFLAIGLILNDEPLKAGTLIFIASLLDAFDGKIARLLGIESRFGVEFDSMADTISFCVVPSILIYNIYIEGLHPLLGSAISFMPIMFGTIRLARFNIDQDLKLPKSYTIGLTTPISTITLFSYLIYNYNRFENYGDPRTALILLSFLCFLMVSPIHFPKFPIFSFNSGRKNSFVLSLFLLTLFFMLIFKGLFLLPITLLFISWNIISWILLSNKNQMEIKN